MDMQVQATSLLCASPCPVRSACILMARCSLEAASMDRPYTPKEIARIVAGAVISLVIVGWMVLFAIGYLSAG